MTKAQEAAIALQKKKWAEANAAGNEQGKLEAKA